MNVDAVDPVTTRPAAPAAPTLGYGRSPRSYRRVVKVALLVLPALALAWWALPRVPPRLKILSQQSALLRQTRAPGTLVWDETEAKVAAIQVTGKPGAGHAMRVIGGGQNVVTAAVLDDPRRHEFDTALGLMPPDFTAFAHARTATAGKTRLVWVMGSVTGGSTGPVPPDAPSGPGRMMGMAAMVIEPGTFFRPPKVVSNPAGPLSLLLHPDDRFRLYAGQLDPADPSRFTIDYDCNGVPGTLNGVVAADDSVTLTPTTPNVVMRGLWGDIILPAGTKEQRPSTSPAE